MRNTITRSFTVNSCKALVYESGKILETVVTIPGEISDREKAEKHIKKNCLVSGKLVSVESMEKVSTLYGMDEEKFIKLAKVVEERSKETRDCITKNVKGYIGTLVYMDKERKIHEKVVMVRKDEKLDKAAKAKAPEGCIGIVIENVHETTALYVMSEREFKENAREMIDHQHYKA